MWYPNLVKDNTEIFLNLKFNLDFASDSEIRDLMKRHYYFESLTYPDVDAEALALQAKADELFEYYNELYKIKIASAEFNPLENYDLREEASQQSHSTSNSSSSGNNTASEYPMDSNSAKPVATGNNSASANAQGNLEAEGTLHRHGNIGIQTLGEIEQKTEQMYKRLYQLKLRYIQEFSRYFMVEI